MTIRERISEPASTLRSLLWRAYLSAGGAWTIFGIGYGLSLIDSRPCTVAQLLCQLPGTLLQLGFLAAALASLPYSAHRLDLGLSWALITTGLTALALISDMPRPLDVSLLLGAPGLAAALAFLVRKVPSHEP